MWIFICLGFFILVKRQVPTPYVALDATQHQQQLQLKLNPTLNSGKIRMKDNRQQQPQLHPEQP